MSDLNTSPPPSPRDKIYPDRLPYDIPPRPILEITRDYTRDTGDISLKWTMTEKHERRIKGFQVFRYRSSGIHAHKWARFWKVSDAASKGWCFTSSMFPKGRYYFAVRLFNDLRIMGPFSPPEYIDL